MVFAKSTLSPFHRGISGEEKVLCHLLAAILHHMTSFKCVPFLLWAEGGDILPCLWLLLQMQSQLLVEEAARESRFCLELINPSASEKKYHDRNIIE
jgi:hypothetical protein